MFEVTLKPLLLVFAAFALVLVNGVFVAAEFAIVRVRRTRLEELVGQGVEEAKDAILVVDRVSEYLAVTQIAITAASLGVGWIGEDAFAHLFILLLPGQPRPERAPPCGGGHCRVPSHHDDARRLGRTRSEEPRHQEGRASPALPRSTAPDSSYHLAARTSAFREALELDFALHRS